MVRLNDNQASVAPSLLVGELAREFTPALVENGTIQARFLPHPATGLGQRSLCGPGHVGNFQVLDTNDGVLIADRRRSLVQKILARIGNGAMESVDLVLGLVPVAAALLLARHAPLVARQPQLMFLEGIQRIDPTAIVDGEKPDDTHVDSDGRADGGDISNVPFRLEADKPFGAAQAHRHILDRAKHRTAVAVAAPAQPRQVEPVVVLIKLAALRKTEAVMQAALLETGESGAACKKNSRRRGRGS